MVPVDIKVRVLHTHVLPRMLYAAEVWWPPPGTAPGLQAVVNDALRMVAGCYRGAHVVPFRQCLSLSALAVRAKVLSLAPWFDVMHAGFLHRARHGRAPGPLLLAALAVLPPDDPWLCRVTGVLALLYAPVPPGANGSWIAGV